MARLTYYCDNAFRIVCRPYTIHNLHKMAEELDMPMHRFHTTVNISQPYSFYTMPMERQKEIMKKCTVVTMKELFLITQKKSIYDGR